jgi:hypothetical protein
VTPGALRLPQEMPSFSVTAGFAHGRPEEDDMNNMRWNGLLLIAALTAGPALAVDPKPVGDPALDLRLSLGAQDLPVFLLEVETFPGFGLEGVVSWTVNGMPVDEVSVLATSGRFVDLRGFILGEASLVCTDLSGRLSLGGDLGRDVVERDCVLWLPSSEPVRPVIGLRDRVDGRKVTTPTQPLPGRRGLR